MFKNIWRCKINNRGILSCSCDRRRVCIDCFLTMVVKSQVVAIEYLCLFGVISNGRLYVANAGDSRVVLGLAVKATGEAIAIQFLTKHSAYIESVREELRSLHLYDHYIVVLKDNVWHVKYLNQGHVVWMMTSTRINNRNG
ncbi:putative protein phosphatase 2C family, PPM-type phosphatase domain superfamily [Helianthus annuus]|nr:putative protein phosphatase 2C family, PPM-type phosphatase domain superfamily [Helianthus annuus]